MNFIISVVFTITQLPEVFSQICRLKNTEYNLLTFSIQEPFTIQLSDYFIGDGLTYNVSSDNQNFNQYNGSLGIGQIDGNIISSTSSNFNNNPNIYSRTYYALCQNLEGSGYQIYSSTLQNSPYSISYQQSFATINSEICYSVDFIQDMVLLTCSDSITNQLIYTFYSTDGTQIYNQTFESIIILSQVFVSTQAAGQYIVTSANQGSLTEDQFTKVSSNLYAFQLIFNAQGQYQMNQIQVPSALSTKNVSDFYTGFSLLANGMLFVSTFYNGFVSINLQTLVKSQSFNYFDSGTLGISAFNADYSQSVYYFVIWCDQGILAGVFNAGAQNDMSFKSQVIQTTQIKQNQLFSTQVFINSQYIIIANENGISVYPSILNNINDWRVLYYFKQSSQSCAFDSYNTILVSVFQSNVYMYLISNPIITGTSQYFTQLYEFTINATSNYYGAARQVSCASLILYVNVTGTQNQYSIFTTSQISDQVQDYKQQGPLFKVSCGSQQNININKILSGPALLAGYPITSQANSNLPNKYSNVLQTPEIDSQYIDNKNIMGEQNIIYSQLFYDITYLTNDFLGEELGDTFLQLVQVSNFIILYQCSALKNQQCKQVLNIPQSNIIVEQFALSFSSSNQLNIAYMWNEYQLENGTYSGHITLYQFTQPYNIQPPQFNSIVFNSQQKLSIKGIQIGIIQDSFYMLYQQMIDGKATNQFAAVSVSDFLIWTGEIPAQTYEYYIPKSFAVYQNPNNYLISNFVFNYPGFGNIIFLNTCYIENAGYMLFYSYYVTIVNYNGGYLNQNPQLIEIETGNFESSNLAAEVSIQLTIEGLYVYYLSGYYQQLTFYSKLSLAPILFISQYQQVIELNNGVVLYLYNISSVVQTAASARFFYIMAKLPYQNTYSILIYKNSLSIQNALYYVIQSDDNIQIENATFSVTSAIQYDEITFKAAGNKGYQNSLILKEYTFNVKCNLNQDFQQQTEYNYIIIKASSLLINNILPQNAPEYWVTFQIMNLISFSVEKSSTANPPDKISSRGYIKIDPRNYFQGNIQKFILLNDTSDQSLYYFSVTSPVEKYPQTENYESPMTAVSAVMQISQSDNKQQGDEYQNQYWFTFVQTNRLVYVTPYVYNNQQNNSKIKIDYPLMYKLPLLDIAANSQKCPLIFVDANSKGVVSVCGNKINFQFRASFTLFNVYTQKVQETQVIDFSDAFPFLAYDETTNGYYELQKATYLEIGVVVLQFLYTYNFGSQPPAIIIFPFLYTSSLETKIANYQNDPLVYYYQFIQPIQCVYQVPTINATIQPSVTVYSITTEYFGGLNASTTSNPHMMFGLLCVSEQNENCLTPFNLDSQSNVDASSGVVITINPNQSLANVFTTNVTISYFKKSTLILSILTNQFQFNILNALQIFTQNSIQQIIQAGIPQYQLNNQISEVPIVIVSKGTAYVFKLKFYLNNGEYIQPQYACTLLGLSEQNPILQIAASSSDGQYQVIAIVSNPNFEIKNQVTVLNYGFINQWCIGFGREKSIINDQQEQIVTAIGSLTYISSEATPILALMLPPQSLSTPAIGIARTLISNNNVITLIDTSPYLILSAYPNFNIKGGTTLNSSNGESNTSEPLIAQISAINIDTYINHKLISGSGGSTLFNLSISQIPINQKFPNSAWDRKLGNQFIWGSIMFVIIIGVLGFLFYKSQPLQFVNL